MSVTLHDGDGNAIVYLASLTEDGMMIESQDDVAAQLIAARPGLVMAVAMVELQKQADLAIDDIEYVFFKI